MTLDRETTRLRLMKRSKKSLVTKANELGAWRGESLGTMDKSDLVERIMDLYEARAKDRARTENTEIPDILKNIFGRFSP